MPSELVTSDLLTRHIGLVVIDRSASANALTPEMAIAMEAELKTLDADPQVRVVLLRGAGGRAFCGGYDLSGVSTGVRDDELQSLLRTLRNMSVPTIAVVDGHAVGAGLDLASSCDLRIVRPGVRIGLPAVRIGVAYDAEGLRQILTKVPGARRLLLTGELGLAEETLGFADLVVATDELDAEILRTAELIASASPAAVAYMTAMVRPLPPTGLDITAARRWRDEILDGPDPRAAADARSNGSDPSFADRIPPTRVNGALGE